MTNARTRRQIGTTAPRNRVTKKNTNVGDLPAGSGRARATRGGATTAAAGRPTAAYQHNQTDLEFVQAQGREIKGGALTGTTRRALAGPRTRWSSRPWKSRTKDSTTD